MQVFRTRAQSHTPIIYIDAIPSALRPYIQHIKDVKADGNCGFRAIADLLGFGEDDWVRVRKDLLQELQCHSDHYRTLYGVEGTIAEITHALSYYDDCPPYDRWMTMPDMGHLIASCYNVVLYHLSLQQCLTFLPLRSVPVPLLSRKDIAIGFVNGNHFVEVLRSQHLRIFNFAYLILVIYNFVGINIFLFLILKVFLLPGHPVPPVATNWRKYHLPCATGWENSYEARIQQFKESISPNVIISETVELD